MEYTIKYIGLGGEINFSKAPFIYDTHNLFDYEQNFDVSDSYDVNGSIIDRIYMVGKTKNISIQVLGPNKRQLLDELELKLNYDVAAKQPGKLYVNNEYVKCYLVASSKTDWDKYNTMEYVTLTIFVENPKWISEDVYDFSIYNKKEVAEGFHFPFSFPFSFKQIDKIRQINNNHYEPVRCKLSIFGPIVNPSIKIGGNIYTVFGELLANERYEIDQVEKTLYKITAYGERINVFHLRDKKQSVFIPIEIGQNEVIYDKSFSFQIKMLIERNEPKWK